MRLTAQQKATVKTTVAEIFGPDAQVRLFGSRVDDTKRGGDIDLLITTPECDVQTLVRSEIALLTTLQDRMGEQKIDLLVDYPSRKVFPAILGVAMQTGVLL
jgi:predicted nucleotidyltransferase